MSILLLSYCFNNAWSKVFVCYIENHAAFVVMML